MLANIAPPETEYILSQRTKQVNSCCFLKLTAGKKSTEKLKSLHTTDERKKIIHFASWHLTF